jgi:hypothetical protein
MKAKRILLSVLLILTVSFTGCSVKIIDRTPAITTASPTGSYTLSAQARINNQAVDPSSLEAFVVIDGEQRAMTSLDPQSGTFSYDYQPPVDELNKRFYYVLNYQTQLHDAAPVPAQIISDLYQIQFPNPITLSLNSKRAAIGTRVSVYGERFSPQDRIFVDTIPAETSFISAAELQFTVPNSPPGHGYAIEVRSTKRAQIAGYLRIDSPSPLRVLPDHLDLRKGEHQALAFALDEPAPIGGLQLNILTDIADSITIPEVLIPEGARSVSASIEAKQAGNGKLMINAEGYPELAIPVSIR